MSMTVVDSNDIEIVADYLIDINEIHDIDIDDRMQDEEDFEDVAAGISILSSARAGTRGEEQFNYEDILWSSSIACMFFPMPWKWGNNSEAIETNREVRAMLFKNAAETRYLPAFVPADVFYSPSGSLLDLIVIHPHDTQTMTQIGSLVTQLELTQVETYLDQLREWTRDMPIHEIEPETKFEMDPYSGFREPVNTR